MGSTPAKVCTALALVWVLAASAPPAVQASWPHDPILGNVGLCTEDGEQKTPAIVSDGAGGAIVAWRDDRFFFGFDLYAQRIGADGLPKWSGGGNPLTSSGLIADSGPNLMVSDGAGGAIVVWQTAGSDIYAQRVNSAGAIQWNVNGVAVCTASGVQYLYAIVPDGAGGAIVLWVDQRAAAAVYAQRLNASGVVQWTPNGVSLGGTPIFLSAASDGAGGAIAAWTDYRRLFSVPSFVDVYARRINASGTVQWAANGVLLGGNPANSLALDLVNTGFPAIVPDGIGGAVVSWSNRTSVTVGDIFAQRLNSSGANQWGASAVALCTAVGAQSTPSCVSDGSGGAIVAWEDDRAGADIYARRITAAGAPQWAADGLALCAAAGGQITPMAASDGAGGAIVAWQDARGGNSDIYARRITGAGAVQWPVDGVALSAAIRSQEYPAIASDGAGGAIVTWQDWRNNIGTNPPDTFAQRVEIFGQIGSPEPVSAGVRDVPNDQGGKVKLSWNASYLDAAAFNYEIASYWIWRSAPPSQAQAALAAGAHLLAPGDSPSWISGRMFTTSIEAGQTVFWEFLSSQPAGGDLGYSYVASTTSDSVAGANPLTLFRIQARDVNGVAFWNSPADSGYSKDNLAPSAPLAFSAQYFPGSEPQGAQSPASAPFTWLHWGSSTEADFLEYRLYRGSTPDFVPDANSFVVAKPDTGYIDVGAPPSYYKLVALDTHGNSSMASAAAPANLVDVEPTAKAKVLSLAPGIPNPMRTSCEIRFAIPIAEDLRLDVYDASGRLVRTLVNERRAAGEYSVRWEGTDEAGRRIGPGLYFLRLKVRDRSLTRKLIAMK